MQKPQNPGKSLTLFFSLFLLVLLVSCTATKKNVLYFENLRGDTVLHNLITKDFELKIRKGDVMSIKVNSLSAENSALFNTPQVAAGGTGTESGYKVDLNGNILYPKLGLVHAEGLTPVELRDRLSKDLLPYLKEPLITVNFANHKVVIIGEVNQVLSMPDESMTLLEAISKSGGIPAAGRKDNILVIRENGADKEFKRLNLNNSSIFTSPFYYLRPNDIIYVEPETMKKDAAKTQQIIAYVSTGLSLLFLLLNRIK